MKAYINTDNVVLAIGENDNLFVGCTPVEVNQEEIDFINSCKLPKLLNNKFVEDFSEENELNEKTQIAIEIDLHYTNLISDLMRKHIEKYAIDGVEIPTNIIEQRNALRNECNEKIIALGITDFTYRKNVRGL